VAADGGGAGGAVADADGGRPGDGLSCGEGETIFPECVSDPAGSFPILPIPIATGVGIATQEDNGGGFHVFASKRGTHMIGVSWGDQAFASCTPWLCFDAVPYPRRVAATALRNRVPEVFVTTDCGELYVRRLMADGTLYAWSNWVSFGLPSSQSFVTDVATSSEPVNHVYIADRGSVYTRHRLSADPYADFGPWQNVGFSDAQVVSAGLTDDGLQQVFVLDRAGRASSALQAPSELGVSFQSPFDFDSDAVPALVDIEAVNGTTPLDVLAVDVQGALWVRREQGAGIFTPWTPWPGALPPEGLVALAAAEVPRVPGATLVLVAVGRSGTTYRVRRVYGVWESWTVHQ
jgi:hypothetical protein